MTSTKRLVVYVGITFGSLLGAIGSRSSSACSLTTQMTYNGGYVDGFDKQDNFGQPHNIYFVFWGYGTYGDPQSFEAAALAEYSNTGLLSSFGIDSRKYYGVPAQYSGYDWASGTFEQIAPTPGVDWIEDEGGLPAPDPTTGQITLTETDVGNEADYIGNYFGLSYDDVMVILLPANAPPPAFVCGAHFMSAGNSITAWIQYPGVGNSCFVPHQQASIQHEITEAVTDAAPNLGVSYMGWNQGGDGECEISDMCANGNFSIQAQQQSATNSIVTTQPEFSNEAVAAGQPTGCVYGRGTSAAIAGLSGGSLYVSTVTADTSLTITNGFAWGAPSGVTLTGAPGVAAWGNNWLDAFVRGTNNKMYHANSFGGFQGAGHVSWELLDSPSAFTQNPDAVSWGAGNVQVFGVQGTNIVRNTIDYPMAWSGWHSVNKPSGVNPVSKVSVASWGATNVLNLFPTDVHTVVAAFRGSDGQVWMGNSVNGGSFTWSHFTPPATLTGDPDLAAWAPPRLDLFVLDTSGNLWDMVSTNGTTLSTSVKFGHPGAGGFQVGGSVAALGDGRLLVGGRVGSNAPYVQFFNWHAGTWASVGFPFTSPIDIAAP